MFRLTEAVNNLVCTVIFWKYFFSKFNHENSFSLAGIAPLKGVTATYMMKKGRQP